MLNSLVDIIIRHKRIIPVIVALVAIGGYMIPANSLALASISGSGNVLQTVSQSNSISASNTGKYGGAFANDNFQTNDASNSAFVQIVEGGHSGKIKDSGNVAQLIDQSNSISADNSGDSGTANANDNVQINSASNSADVQISNDPSGGGHHHHSHGAKISDSGNVVQQIDQSNSISASNSGDSGTANANDNTQVNDAHNNADVQISNQGSHDSGNQGSHDSGKHGSHDGGKIKDSGNVVQSISQSNSVSADNSGDHGSASANDNTQVNSASNNANVDVKNK